MDTETVVILGVPVDNLTMDEAMARIFSMVDAYASDGRPRQIATVNVDFLVNANAWLGRHIRHPELIAIIIVTALVLLYIKQPGKSTIYPPCLIYKITGYYCPGCGSMRALNCLLHGDLKGFINFNPILLFIIPFLIIMFIKKSIAYNPVVSRYILYILICFTILRNIKNWPFIYLAPH